MGNEAFTLPCPVRRYLMQVVIHESSNLVRIENVALVVAEWIHTV